VDPEQHEEHWWPMAVGWERSSRRGLELRQQMPGPEQVSVGRRLGENGACQVGPAQERKEWVNDGWAAPAS
jgi:hypothetical protein